MLQLYYNNLIGGTILKNFKITHFLSISATVITLVAIAYGGIATTWGLPFGPEVYETGIIITSAISALLGGTTVKKLVDKNHNGIPDSEEENDGKVDEFSEKA